MKKLLISIKHGCWATSATWKSKNPYLHMQFVAFENKKQRDYYDKHSNKLFEKMEGMESLR